MVRSVQTSLQTVLVVPEQRPDSPTAPTLFLIFLMVGRVLEWSVTPGVSQR